MPSTTLRKQIMAGVRSIVVKAGTNLLTCDHGKLDQRVIASLADQIATLIKGGVKVTLVSSGAVGAGMGKTGMLKRPRSMPVLQAAAAIGQPSLMSLYEREFARHDLLVGQVLVTRKDFERRNRYVNISNTIAALQRLKAVPIINENDTVAIDELDRFADNDTIAAMVTNLMRADLLALLTVVDGLLDSRGQLVDLVPAVNTEVESLARAERSPLGSGGMFSKLGAARMVSDAGECVVIANGRHPDALLKLLSGERVGTIFAPAARKLSARQRWIAGAVRPTGVIVIDAGAANAVHTQGKSLLLRGVTRIEGKFDRGSIVRIADADGRVIAHGISNYSSAELDTIKGLKSSEIAAVLGAKPFDEAVHRDNLVIIAGRK
ncbi:MAG: glutamate 5-kinase [Phycisphaerae bacterium]|nr:glutamate 5-kinase [Phycisphaerae bacterium]